MEINSKVRSSEALPTYKTEKTVSQNDSPSKGSPLSINDSKILTKLNNDDPIQKDSKIVTLYHNFSEELGEGIVKLGKIKFIKSNAYKLYGLLTKPDSDDPKLSNMGNLTNNLMRGAQPTEQGFLELKKQGVNTVINLRPEANWEQPMLKNLNIKEIYLPLPTIGKPSIQQGIEFLKIATDKSNGKVFFHCQHGADRTGAMAAIYRIAVQGWDVNKAIDEMGKYNFHEGLENAKLDFVHEFNDYWKTLPQQEKNKIINK